MPRLFTAMQNRGVAQEIETVARNSPEKTAVGADQTPPRQCELSPFRPMTEHERAVLHETSGRNADWNPGIEAGFDHSLPSRVE